MQEILGFWIAYSLCHRFWIVCPNNCSIYFKILVHFGHGIDLGLFGWLCLERFGHGIDLRLFAHGLNPQTKNFLMTSTSRQLEWMHYKHVFDVSRIFV